MTVYSLSFRNKEYKWSESQLAQRLEALGNLQKRKAAWIRKDLSLGHSNWLTRLVWKVAKYFGFIRKHLYKVDLAQSRSLLKQIGSQVKDDKNLFGLFTKALGTFNKVAPRHKLVDFLPDKEIVVLKKPPQKSPAEPPPKDSVPRLSAQAEKQPSKSTPLPVFIRQMVDKHGLTAHKTLQLVERIYGKDTLSKEQKTGIKMLARQHIDRDAPKSAQLNFSAPPALDPYLKAASALLGADSFTEITGKPFDAFLSASHKQKITKDSERRDFREVLCSPLTAPRSAIFLKKPFAVAVIARSPAEFWLFDGSGSEESGKATLERLFSLDAVVDALHARCPHVDPAEMGYFQGSEKDLELNGFSAYILAGAGS